MQNQFVFEEEKEIERLGVQNALLYAYEAPVIQTLFPKGGGYTVLDVGCNDGSKTVERFSLDAVGKVIGIEYNEALAQRAEQCYGGEKFSFYSLDAEAPDFPDRLAGVMKAGGIRGFDVICLSLVLMHLSDAKALIAALRPFLMPDGKLFIVEANDRASTLSNDQNDLLGDFLEILKKDKYSGNREVGAAVCEILSDCGYEDIRVWHDAISAGSGETKKKKAIFETFFTYLPEDISLLLEAEPENEEYKSWSAWVDRNYKALKRLILQKESAVSMGIKILTCTRGKK